ncbi:TetR/AcrR family transcriptional regulator [Pseudodesulfovibrio sp.]|nr:TetR/AcrR family transcriptional regulator [Pseudodesulfovibrio sp.]
MKISQKQRAKNREAIIQAAVEMIIEKGLKSATMRGIAKTAGVSGATIYNYFPTKESILYAYYGDRFATTAQTIARMEDLDELSLQEHLQALFEELLTDFLEDREFLQATFQAVFFSMPPNHKNLKPIQDVFFDCVRRAFEAAVERGELEEQVFQELVVRFYWDYFMGVVVYWMKDSSEQFSDTSILIDKSMALGCATLKAGVVNKAFDICTFLFRNHVLAHLGGPSVGLEVLNVVKDSFFGDHHERSNS